MKVKFTNIDWDTDGEEVGDLPTETVIEVDAADWSEDDIGEFGADWLSDKFDWCVISYNYEVVEE